MNHSIKTARTKHKPRYCSIANCKEEAIRWYTAQNEKDIYLCEDHNFQDDDPSETAVYSCSDSCTTCNQ